MSNSENLSMPKTEVSGCSVDLGEDAFMNVEKKKLYFVGDVGSSDCESEGLEFVPSRSVCARDGYSHVSQNVSYVDCNVPGRGCDLEDFEVQYAKGCDCLDGECVSERSCPCIARYGKNYEDYRLLPEKYCGPVVECNSECGCAAAGRCENSLVQQGPRRFLEIFGASDGKGLGLKTNVAIPRGGFVCEYAGEVVGVAEARRRANRTSPGHMNYVFVLNEHLSDSTVIKTCVDPTSVGNVGRYINHSCLPNCAVVPVRVDCPVPRLSVFTMRDVAAGEEVTFDYAGERSMSEEPSSSAATVGRTPCNCLAENCRKYLPFDPALL